MADLPQVGRILGLHDLFYIQAGEVCAICGGLGEETFEGGEELALESMVGRLTTYRQAQIVPFDSEG